jgi:hypothetical protein
MPRTPTSLPLSTLLHGKYTTARPKGFGRLGSQAQKKQRQNEERKDDKKSQAVTPDCRVELVESMRYMILELQATKRVDVRCIEHQNAASQYGQDRPTPCDTGCEMNQIGLALHRLAPALRAGHRRTDGPKRVCCLFLLNM